MMRFITATVLIIAVLTLCMSRDKEESKILEVYTNEGVYLIDIDKNSITIEDKVIQLNSFKELEEEVAYLTSRQLF